MARLTGVQASNDANIRDSDGLNRDTRQIVVSNKWCPPVVHMCDQLKAMSTGSAWTKDFI